MHSFAPLLLVLPLALVPVPLFICATLAQTRPLPTYLQSGDGDLIRVQKGGLPPRVSRSEGNGPADTIESRLVTVCLKNASTTARHKGFDIRRTDAPRFVAPPGGRACAHLEPTRHRVYFWKADASGPLSLTLSGRLDLSDTDGTLVTLDWVLE